MKLYGIERKVIPAAIVMALVMIIIFSFCSSSLLLFKLYGLERRKQKAFSELLAREKKLMVSDLDARRKTQSDAYRELFLKLRETEKNSAMAVKPAAGSKEAKK